MTGLCSYESLDRQVAEVDRDGNIEAKGVGDAAIIVRYRAEPVMALVVVPRPGGEAFPDVAENNFIDRHVLAKLRRLNIPPSGLADDATFLRRISLDLSNPTPRDVLNAIVRLEGGLSWSVRYESPGARRAAARGGRAQRHRRTSIRIR